MIFPPKLGGSVLGFLFLVDIYRYTYETSGLGGQMSHLSEVSYPTRGKSEMGYDDDDDNVVLSRSL